MCHGGHEDVTFRRTKNCTQSNTGSTETLSRDRGLTRLMKEAFEYPRGSIRNGRSPVCVTSVSDTVTTCTRTNVHMDPRKGTGT